MAECTLETELIALSQRTAKCQARRALSEATTLFRETTTDRR